uniref:Secreted protein n=1 Tax=Aegilops tauschii subsp. strangulata TaxID=200361 RepID=A0A452YPT4_AEGTS
MLQSSYPFLRAIVFIRLMSWMSLISKSICPQIITIGQAHYASWEPRHSMQCYSYPWQKYVKLGSVLRHFAYTVADISILFQ